MWKISVADRVATMIVDIETLAKVSIDGVSLTVDDKGNALSFINRQNGSLWLYKL
jgi:citrate lyase gamma subunit